MFEQLSKKRMVKLLAEKIKNYKYTFLFTGMGVILITFLKIININLFYILLSTIASLYKLNIQEFLILFLFTSSGFVLDLYKKRIEYIKILNLKNQSYSIFKATMESLNDLMSNYIQSVQLYRSEMEGKSNPQIEKELDEVTGTLLLHLRELEESEEVKEEELYANISLLKNKLEDIEV